MAWSAVAAVMTCNAHFEVKRILHLKVVGRVVRVCVLCFCFEIEPYYSAHTVELERSTGLPISVF